MMKDRLIANRMEENFLREIFESMDCDGNGYISAEEVAKALKLTQEEADDLVREVDEDGDGRISYHGAYILYNFCCFNYVATYIKMVFVNMTGVLPLV